LRMCGQNLLELRNQWTKVGYSAPIHPDLIIFSAYDGRRSVAIDSLHEINHAKGKVSANSSHLFYDNRDWSDFVPSTMPASIQVNRENAATSAGVGVGVGVSSVIAVSDENERLQSMIYQLQQMRSVLILQTMCGNKMHDIQLHAKSMPMAATAEDSGLDILDLCSRKLILLQHLYRFLSNSRPMW